MTNYLYSILLDRSSKQARRRALLLTEPDRPY